MGKILIMSLSVILFLSGCTQVAEDDIKSISVSKQKGVDELIFDDTDSIEIFQSILSSAKKEPGIVDVAEPEFIFGNRV